MNQTVVLHPTETKKIVKQLEQFDDLKTVLLKLLPESSFNQGSNLWWQKQILTGDEAIQKGDYQTFENPQDFISHLKSLS